MPPKEYLEIRMYAFRIRMNTMSFAFKQHLGSPLLFVFGDDFFLVIFSIDFLCRKKCS